MTNVHSCSQRTDGRTAYQQKMFSFHFNDGLFSWRISLRLIPEWLTIKSVIKESSFECPKHLIQFQLTFFLWEVWTLLCVHTYIQRLSVAKSSVCFPFRSAFRYQLEGGPCPISVSCCLLVLH